MFTVRQKKLIRLLEERRTVNTAKDLATSLGVSLKTVRNDIAQINQLLPQPLIESKSGRGYFINEFVLPEECFEEENSVENLRFEVLKYVLEAEETDFFQVADYFYISESTLARTIRDINQIISSRYDNLSILRVNNQLLVTGGEEGKRLIFNLFLNQEIENHKLSLEEYSDYFEHSDLKALSQLVIDHHKKIDFYINDFSTISFILHIAVLIERVSQGSYLQPDQLPQYDKKSYCLAKEFAEKLKEQLDITIPSEEFYYIARLYNGKFILPDADLERKFTSVVSYVIHQINETFLIDFSEDQRMQDYLTAHLSALYRRSLQHQYLTNPLTEEVKNKYPFIYNVSVFAADIIRKQLSMQIPEDEIAYITLHFLSASENIHFQKKRKVLLLSPYGIASRRLIRNKLKKLDYSLEIMEVDSIFDLKEKLDDSFDLIITTEKLNLSQPQKLYYCPSIFGEQDLQEVARLLEEKENKENILYQFFKEELFFPKQSFKNKEEVIQFLCQQLNELGYCDEEYEEKVFSREQLSSTSFGNYYAIPHAIERSAQKNGVAVCCLDKPLDWGSNKVRLVFLMALKKERDNAFEELFSSFAHVLDDSRFVKELAKQENFADFIELYQK